MNETAFRSEASVPQGLLPWAAAVAGGIAAFLGYAGFGQFYLEWICLVPILWAVSGHTPKRAFLIGWLAGIVGHGGGFYWIVTLLRQFADAPLLLAVLALLGLAAANGLIFAFWAWATRVITRGAGWGLVWVSPVVWTAAEKFWPEVFPNYLGASQYRLPLVTQIADITGILGVTFLLIYINTVVYVVIDRVRNMHRHPWRPAVVCAVVLAAVIAYGAVRISMVDASASAAAKLSVGLVQTDRGAGDTHVDAALFLREHQDMSRDLAKAEPLDLIVWPESILGMQLSSRQGTLPPAVMDGLHTPLLFGAVIQTREEGELRMYNSAVLADADGRILGTYDKTVLVPFGEYIPFGDVFPQLYAWSPYSGRFWKGKITEPLSLNGHILTVNICYEDIFPTHVRMLMQGGREHRIPEVIFNLTNDSWYGDTIEPLEHLVLASFRSIENRRSLVRATNTGISAIVDPAGRIAEHTAQWTKASLTGRVPLMHGRTVYGALGDWLGWACGGITLLGLGRAWQSERAAKTVRQQKNASRAPRKERGEKTV
jgi:apolipoprotein N-acyltransferase